MTFAKTCAPATFPKNGEHDTARSPITNPSFEPRVSCITDALPKQLQLDLSERRRRRSTTRNLLLQRRARCARSRRDVAIAPGASPAATCRSRTSAIPPIGGVGDETIVNFNVPAFAYAGRDLDRASASSATATSSSAADRRRTSTSSTQNLPDPARPNNVLAPFWTDLNPAAGGALRIATLTDGVDNGSSSSGRTCKRLQQRHRRIRSRSGSASTAMQIPARTSPTRTAPAARGDRRLPDRRRREPVRQPRQNVTYFNGAGTLPANGTQLRVSSTPGSPGETQSINFTALRRQAR